MAYVRKTMQLLSDVTDNVRAMKDRELTLLGNSNIDSATPIYAELREQIQKQAWVLAPHLRSQMPKDWVKEKAEAYVMYRLPDGERSTRMVFTTGETDKLKLPPNVDGWRWEVTVEREHATPSLDKWYEDASNRDKQAQVIAEKYSTISEQLHKFIDSHASLNAALKEMPQLEMYIPDAYMTKLRAASAPRVKQERVDNREALGIDTDLLASSAIAHRIATSGGGS